MESTRGGEDWGCLYYGGWRFTVDRHVRVSRAAEARLSVEDRRAMFDSPLARGEVYSLDGAMLFSLANPLYCSN